MTTTEAVRRAINETFGDVEHSVTEHDSGALSLTIRTAAGHTVVIDGSGDEWGVSIDPQESDAFTGHPATTPSLDEALRAADRELRRR